jgi:hypothetical protein
MKKIEGKDHREKKGWKVECWRDGPENNAETKALNKEPRFQLFLSKQDCIHMRMA